MGPQNSSQRLNYLPCLHHGSEKWVPPILVSFPLGRFLMVNSVLVSGRIYTSWWWDQPIRKICSSNWIISPGFRVKIKNLWNHHPNMYTSFQTIFSFGGSFCKSVKVGHFQLAEHKTPEKSPQELMQSSLVGGWTNQPFPQIFRGEKTYLSN